MRKRSTNYQIDQSGKVEQTSAATIVTLANGSHKTIKISSVEKRKLIKVIIELDFPKLNYMHKIFSALIFILIKDENLLHVLIDKEYPGHEADIKNILLDYFSKYKITPPEIDFGLVGKHVNAHIIGIETYRKRRKAGRTVTAEEVLQFMYRKNKKGWRSRSSRDNP